MENAFAIIGSAGFGKTTRVNDSIVELLAGGSYAPDNVLIVGLTHATANAVRAKGIPINIDDDVRTMDSLCWRMYATAYGNPKLFQPNTGAGGFSYSKATRGFIDDFCNEFGWKLYHDAEDTPPLFELMNARDTVMWSHYCLWRQRGIPREKWEELAYGLGIRWKTTDSGISAMEQFIDDFETYSRISGAVDFTAIKQRVAISDIELPANYRIAYFDEAQDFNRLEIDLCNQWGQRLDFYVFAGDPNQAIYEQMRGAVGPGFLDGVPHDNVVTLPRSYRCAEKVLSFGLQIAARADDFLDYTTYGPIAARESGGAIERVSLSLDRPELIAEFVETHINDGSSMAVLCSHDGYYGLLSRVGDELKRRGILFHNPYTQDSRWQSFHPKTIARIKAFVSNEWTIKEVREWAELVPVAGTFLRGVKARLNDTEKRKAAWPAEQEVTREMYTELFEPSARDALIARDLQWLAEKAEKAPKRAVNLAASLVEKYGSTDILYAEPSVILGTVHSVKGGEADAVLVFPDISSMSGQYGSQRERHRLYYVAVTRARDSVYLGMPTQQSARRGLVYKW